MHIEKITYQKAFPIGPFLQEKLGIEIILNDTSPEVAYSRAKEIVDKWHEENNPHLYGTAITDSGSSVTGVEFTKDGWAIPVIQQQQEGSHEIDQQFEAAKAIVESIDHQEDAIQWMNNNGWTFNIDLKNIAKSKPKKLPKQ